MSWIKNIIQKLKILMVSNMSKILLNISNIYMLSAHALWFDSINIVGIVSKACGIIL